jgi:hypothetical protein
MAARRVGSLDRIASITRRGKPSARLHDSALVRETDVTTRVVFETSSWRTGVAAAVEAGVLHVAAATTS